MPRFSDLTLWYPSLIRIEINVKWHRRKNPRHRPTQNPKPPGHHRSFLNRDPLHQRPPPTPTQTALPLSLAQTPRR